MPNKVITNKNLIDEVLNKGVEKIYPSPDALRKVLSSGKRLRVYCGYDPTAPSLHIGHAITLRKLSQFQKLGHEVIMLIGDFTAMIGDPTDKTATRKRLSRKEVLKNLKDYKKQAAKILNFTGKNPAKIKYNSKWHSKITFDKLIELAANFTVQQMIVRDMFQERIKKDKPIYLHEFLYPLAQAYDSVAMNVDLEVGGNDQTFNMLCGRDLMKSLKNKEKFVLTTKLLVDPTGKKMGKTEGNVVNLNDAPKDMYGKVMSWPDSLILPGFELCTDFSIKEIKEIELELKNKKTNPRDLKAVLAREIVSIHHSKKAAIEAEREFNRIFKEKSLPSKMPYYKSKLTKASILDLLIEAKLTSSKSEAKRLVEQGAVRINNRVINSWRQEIKIQSGMVLQVGKRRFLRIVKK